MSPDAIHIVPSIDPEESVRYAALADTWWDKSGPFWPLHVLNELRVDYIREVLCAHFDRDPRTERPLSGLLILDVGCGGGILSESVARLGAEVHGIDVVERNIAVARHHALQTGIDISYRFIAAEELAEQGVVYDVVLNMEVVEHVADLSGFLEACGKLIRPGGLMFVATINRTLLSWLFAIVGAEYVLRWLPRGAHRWRRFRTPTEIAIMLGLNGLQLLDKRGVRVNPFSRRMTLSSFTAVNYMVVAAKNQDR